MLNTGCADGREETVEIKQVKVMENLKREMIWGRLKVENL